MSAWQLARCSHLVVSDDARCPHLRLGLEHDTAFEKLHHCGHVILLSQPRSEWLQRPLLKVGDCGLARTVLLMVVRAGDLPSHRICSLQEDQGDLRSHQVVLAAYLGPQLSLSLVGLYSLESLTQERLWKFALHHENFLAFVIRLVIKKENQRSVTLSWRRLRFRSRRRTWLILICLQR